MSNGMSNGMSWSTVMLEKGMARRNHHLPTLYEIIAFERYAGRDLGKNLIPLFNRQGKTLARRDFNKLLIRLRSGQFSFVIVRRAGDVRGKVDISKLSSLHGRIVLFEV